MFGRTTRTALFLTVALLSSGCWHCCERPWFWRIYLAMWLGPRPAP